MPKKSNKSKTTIKNKNKNKINIKININSNNKKKSNKSNKQPAPAQPNFQNPIVHISPVQPLQNTSLLDNQYGIGIATQINALEGDYNRIKIGNEEIMHNIYTERLEREKLADLVQKRVDDLRQNTRPSLLQPDESNQSFYRPNPYSSAKNSQGFSVSPSNPFDNNNSYNPPTTTPELRVIKSRYYNKKPIEELDNIRELTDVKYKPKTTLKKLANKLRTRSNMIETATSPSDIVKPSRLQDLAHKFKIKKMKDEAINRMDTSTRNRRDYELRKLKEDITDKHKNPKAYPRRRSNSK
jgi:hypothetical protein